MSMGFLNLLRLALPRKPFLVKFIFEQEFCNIAMLTHNCPHTMRMAAYPLYWPRDG